VLAYIVLAPDVRSQAASRIDELQMNPERIKLLGTTSRGPAGPGANLGAGKGGPYGACLEWGPFMSADVARADSALARLTLKTAPMQRVLSEAAGVKRVAYYLREPDTATVAQIAGLQREFPGTQIRAGPCPA
jgi:hypothetical protein